MNIAGLQKLTLLDYPGKTAATIFTAGCNFRCPFCQNVDLVNPARMADLPLLSEEDFFSFLDKRQGLLDGVCITGGEPTLQVDLSQFCLKIKEKGFLVKLDTNGSKPHMLRALIEKGCIDYVAMDIKNTPEEYEATAGLKDKEVLDIVNAVTKSILVLLRASIPFELRTTVVAELHSKKALTSLASWLVEQTITAGKQPTDIHWYLQQFVDSETVLAGEHRFTSWNEADLHAILPHLQAILPHTALRGIS